MKGKALDINEDLKHEQLKWKIERISWFILLIITAVALTGLLGSGPLSKETRESNSFIIKYSTIERYDSPTEIEINTRFIPTNDFSIRINDKFIKEIDQLSIYPQPKSNYIENDDEVFVFDAKEGNKALVSILFQFTHNKSGIKKLRAGINKDYIETTQIILP